jgi:hypothetical protein
MNSNITENINVSDVVIEIFNVFTYLFSLVTVAGVDLLRC